MTEFPLSIHDVCAVFDDANEFVNSLCGFCYLSERQNTAVAMVIGFNFANVHFVRERLSSRLVKRLGISSSALAHAYARNELCKFVLRSFLFFFIITLR